MHDPGNPFGPPPQAQPPFQPPAYTTPIPSPSGEMPYRPVTSPPGANDSGTGSSAVLPAELRGFNWGAFLLTWIWAIGQQFWLGLLFIPVSMAVGFVCGLIPVPFLVLAANIALRGAFGYKASEWAWQARKWDSIEEFRNTQRTWAICGAVVAGFIVMLMIAAGVILGGVILPYLMKGGQIPGFPPSSGAMPSGLPAPE